MNVEVEIAGQEGKCQVGIDDFFYGFYMIVVQYGEILINICILILKGKFGMVYYKLECKVGDYVVAGVVVMVEIGDDGICMNVGIGFINVNLLFM